MKNECFSIVYSISNTNAPYRLLYVYKIRRKQTITKPLNDSLLREKEDAINEHKQNNIAQHNKISIHFLSL